MFDSNKHHRRSIRLKDYDYSSEGAYFITICTQDRVSLFGEIIEGRMRASQFGSMIQSTWGELSENYFGIETDEFVLMPNHIHGVILINCDVGATLRGCPDEAKKGQAPGPAPTQPLSLPDIVHRFKSLTTTRYLKGMKTLNWPPFNKRLWQRNYYERIVRTEKELSAIREYIRHNPGNWDADEDNPINFA